MARSGRCTAVVAVEVLLVDTASPGVLTVPVLVTLLPAVAPTVPTIVIAGAVAPAASGPGLVHVTGVAALHVQPVPDAEVKVRSDGSGSVTVIVPTVAPVPTFCTDRV